MNILPGPILFSLVFIVGLCIGSFLNVCIWRLPAEEQVMTGRSHCRSCRQSIPWYDNIPLASFCWLKARCRFCGTRISWLYPFVELATGLLMVGILARFGFNVVGAVTSALAAALVLLSVIDARQMILPDEVTLPGLQLGVILSFFFPVLHGTASRWEGLYQSVLGAVAGAGFLWVLGVVGSWVFRREAMGGGDVKLMAMVGSLIGWPKVLLVNLILAPLLGSVVGLIVRFRYGQHLIPYGPFLALGTLIALFWGDGMIHWYRSLWGQV